MSDFRSLSTRELPNGGHGVSQLRANGRQDHEIGSSCHPVLVAFYPPAFRFGAVGAKEIDP